MTNQTQTKQCNPEDFKALGSSRKVLIVDDKQENLAVARKAYEMLGFNTDCVQRPNEALDKIKQGGYAAVITDVMFPLELIDEDTNKSYVSQLERAINHLRIPENTVEEYDRYRHQFILNVKAKQWGNKSIVIGCDEWQTGSVPELLLKYNELRYYNGLKEHSIDEKGQKSIGTLIYEQARKANIPAYMATDLHTHGLENSAGIEMILLPLALEFPDFFTEIGSNEYRFGDDHIEYGNKENMRTWINDSCFPHLAHEFITSNDETRKQVADYFFDLDTNKVKGGSE